ncbi:RDD family protein [Corynebacterium freneyi]|uniref:RDD family protein n=1 Tax=Corynebacterium freneyi TaxID=134034 RepID=UPI00396C54AE
MQHERNQADPTTSVNPSTGPYANPFDVNPYANPFATPSVPAPVPGQAPTPAPHVARTPVPADHPLLGVPRNPHITPATVAAAEALGYDPDAVNAPLRTRFGALFVDAIVYAGLLGVILVLLGAFGPPDAWAYGAVAAIFAGPAGFYGYRAMGDAVFEGSPGKHIFGLHMSGPNGLPVSGTDGLRRNLWILPSMIPGLGWMISLAMMAWIGLSAGNDPLGRGGHERAVGTRVTEKKEK